jgi:hypothetical protein
VASVSTGLSHLRDFYLAAESPSFDFSTRNFPIVSAASVLRVSAAPLWVSISDLLQPDISFLFLINAASRSYPVFSL